MIREHAEEVRTAALAYSLAIIEVECPYVNTVLSLI